MTLFFSRRALDTKNNRFSKNISKLTRYVSITGKTPGGKWSAQLLDKDEWVAAVRAEATSDDVLIYIHGFNTKQKDMLDRHELIETGLRDHGFRGSVVAYDWPSEGRAGLGPYRRDLRKAEKVGRFLVADGILALLESSWRPRVHLIGHSMGAFMTLDGFSKFGDTNGPGSGPWKVDQILFASGDAHRRDFEKGTAGSLVLKHHSKRLTNYYSNDDAILTLAVTYHGKARVGQQGMPDLVFSEHLDLYSTEQYRRHKPPFNDNGEEALFSHRWWFENDGFFQDAALTLRGDDANSMPTRRTTNTGGLALWT